MANYMTTLANGQQKCAACGKIPKRDKKVYQKKGGLIKQIFGDIYCTKSCLEVGNGGLLKKILF